MTNPGDQFGRLFVVAEAGYRGSARHVDCRCTCGNDVIVGAYKLKSGHTQSCGCLKRDRTKAAKTGTTRTPGIVRATDRTYSSYKAMLHRCGANSTVPGYRDRGITVCDRWLGPDGFDAFLADMGVRPPGVSLDRIDNDRGYWPQNCRWATQTQQSLNQRHEGKARRRAGSIDDNEQEGAAT